MTLETPFVGLGCGTSPARLSLVPVLLSGPLAADIVLVQAPALVRDGTALQPGIGGA